jgi:translation elongation factor EF-Tu-like GTPase
MACLRARWAHTRSCSLNTELLDLVEIEVRELLAFLETVHLSSEAARCLRPRVTAVSSAYPPIVRLAAAMDRHVPLLDRVIKAPFLVRIEDVSNI